MRQLIAGVWPIRALFFEERGGRLRLKPWLRRHIAWACQRSGSLRRLLTPNDAIAVALLWVAGAGALAAIWALAGEIALLVGLCIGLGPLLVLLISHADLRSRREGLASQSEHLVQQFQGVLSLHSMIRPRRPLPPLGRYAVSPDVAAVIASTVLSKRPKTVVELGSGASTLIVGYCLEQLGYGRCISLEHDSRYSDISAARVADHELTDYVEVRHAPLKEVTVEEETWLWYDLQALADLDSIDLLIVDGPPGYLGRMARYPGLPLLFEKLNDGALTIMDDCFRQDERRILERWLRECPGITVEMTDTQKQAVILRLGPRHTKITGVTAQAEGSVA